jgi:hypothetical protein
MIMSPRTDMDESDAVPNATVAIHNKAMNVSRAITIVTESLSALPRCRQHHHIGHEDVPQYDPRGRNGGSCYLASQLCSGFL